MQNKITTKTCKSCGAYIIWIETINGKKMPCNAFAVPYWNDPNGKDTVMTLKGETVRCTLQPQRTPATGRGYISHFATCPQANKHRKGEVKE